MVIDDIKEDILLIPQTKTKYKEFGIVVGGVLVGFGIWFWFREKTYYIVPLTVGGILMGIGLIKPMLLRIIYVLWMILAAIMGFFMSRLLLSLLFFLALTPITLMAKISGKQFLNLKKTSGESYWHSVKNKIDYTKQY